MKEKDGESRGAIIIITALLFLLTPYYLLTIRLELASSSKGGVGG